MAENSKIEWTDHTINFWWGCTKVSPACANCYAEGAMPGKDEMSENKITKQVFQNRDSLRMSRADFDSYITQERDRIADLWAGCITDAEGHGPVDVGASIRAGQLVDA